ncbi:hypothetical protein ACQ4PT_048944 [Festuca glaucescens]
MADLTVGLAKSVVEGTLSKAHAAIQEEAKLRQSAQRDLVFITGEFEMMRSFLNVANAERVENPVVRTWVRQIRELAYDVEDCIELVVHLDKDRTSFWFRLRRLCVPWTPARMPALDQAVDEIEQLKARVADVSTRNVRYSLISDTGSKPVVQQQLPAAAAGVTVAAANMLAEARDAARRVQGIGGGDLTQLITKNVGVDLQVISVWGSGGDHGTASIIMKTYGDTEICSNFTHKAWVKLTHPFSPHELVRSLMLQFCLAEQPGMDVLTMMQATQEVLFNNFQEIVTQKRYLVVVEDLSNMAEWHAFKKFLPDRRKGSWIIVSTQQPEIATLCVGHSYQILELKHFSAEHSVCALFNKGSHSDGDEGKKPVVEESYSLVGRDSLIDQLRQYPAKARINSCQVMSVWGIAGVGKSALVKNLFDHTCYTGQFEKYHWVDVPHPFNLRDFHRSIPLDFRLETQSWLIVIDDIKSKQEWDLMQSSLLPRSSRSVIIIITTEASIAAYCSSGEELVLNVKGLEAAAASSLFEKVCRTIPASTKVQEDTRVKELISKCGGLPKVIVAIADYIRAGNSDIPTTATPSALSWLPEFCRCSRVVGVVVPTGIRKLTALHTLGIVNVAASGGKTMVKALKKLTQLHKLGVSGINRKNIKDFSSAIKDHVNLESLSVHLDKDNQSCLDGIALPLGKLRSLKLYGLNESLPQGSDQLIMLRKLDLEMNTLSQSDIKLLGELPKLCILRLSVKQPSLNFISKLDASELSSYEKVKILEISCSSSLLSLEFGAKSMKTLELLKLDCSRGTPYDFTTSMDFLSELKEVSLIGIHGETFKTNLANKLRDYTKKPVLKLQELPRSS